MSLSAFSTKVKTYLKAAGYSQKILAHSLNFDPSLLSHKLNGTGRTILTHPEIREIIKQLTSLEAITRQSEALELLTLVDCPNFPRDAWKVAPLNTLEPDIELDLQPRLSSKPVTSFVQTEVVGTFAKGGVVNSAIQTGEGENLPPNNVLTPAAPTTHALDSTYSLPQNLTPILGRTREVGQILELIGNPHIRLVTLTGAGGSGKTSLALEVGNQLPANFTGRVYFVRLEHVNRQNTMLGEIAGTLKVKETPGQDLLPSLKEYLRDKELLLILDNLEQLVTETDVLSELLKENRLLKLLVTSRIPLQLSFEYEFPVQPLSLPDKQGLVSFTTVELTAAFPAIALFAARAKSVKPDFTINQENVQAVVEICRRVDGLPLALELAAARVRTYTPDKLLERLSLKVLTGGARDLPARQKTLWHTIEWSYHLLLNSEQRLFARLSVFVGGCTLEAAEAVCNSNEELKLDVFLGIESLLTQNLLKQWQGVDGETRYGMLVTIREFGLEKLAQNGEFKELLQWYLTFYLERSRQLASESSGVTWQADLRLREIQSDYVNYRAVLHQVLEDRMAPEALELSGNLGFYFDSWGYPGEAASLLEQSLTLPYSGATPAFKALRAKAFWWLGNVHYILGDLEKAQRAVEETLALKRELNDKPGIILCLNRLVWFTSFTDNKFAIADIYMAESLALSLELNEEEPLENTRSTLAMKGIRHGKYAEAQHWFEENLLMCTASGDKRTIGIALNGLGEVAFNQGKFEEAEGLLLQSTAIFRELAISWGIASSLFQFGLVALNQGKHVEALRYSQECLAISQEFGLRWTLAASLFNLGLISLCEDKYQEARSFLEDSLAIMQNGDRYYLAQILFLLGLIAVKLGKQNEGLTYYSESLKLSQELENELLVAHNLTGLAALCVQSHIKHNQTESSIPSKHLIRVARISGVISALLASCGAVMYRPFPLLYDQNLMVAKGYLDEVTFKAAIAEGQGMQVGEAVTYALAD